MLTYPIMVSAGDTFIKLNADGTWSGDGKAFLAALATVDLSEHPHPAPVIMWLVAHAIRAQVLLGQTA